MMDILSRTEIMPTAACSLYASMLPELLNGSGFALTCEIVRRRACVETPLRHQSAQQATVLQFTSPDCEVETVPDEIDDIVAELDRHIGLGMFICGGSLTHIVPLERARPLRRWHTNHLRHVPSIGLLWS
ncbi:hypothetical protein AEB_P2474 [Altererythrobacter sp. B11]|nr:hypothetical protein AEB_P2474 [Altererythrobacter sp. B11]